MNFVAVVPTLFFVLLQPVFQAVYLAILTPPLAKGRSYVVASTLAFVVAPASTSSVVLG